MQQESILCTLESKSDLTTNDILDNLDLKNNYEFEIVDQSRSLSIVRLYVDGKIVSRESGMDDDNNFETTGLDNENEGELDKNTTGNDLVEDVSTFVNQIIDEAIEIAEKRYLDNLNRKREEQE